MEASDIQAFPAAAFNLAQYEAADSAVMTVRNKADTEDLKGTDGQPVKIELYGPASIAYLRVNADIERENTARMLDQMGKGDVSTAPHVDNRTQLIRRLTACTKSISPNFPVSASDLWNNPKLGYITEQGARFFNRWGNF